MDFDFTNRATTFLRVALKFNDLAAQIVGKTLQARKSSKPPDDYAKFIKRGSHLLNLARLQIPHGKDANDYAWFAGSKTAIFLLHLPQS